MSSENIEHLKKTVSAMKKKGAKSILLELQFLEDLCAEIDEQSTTTVSTENPVPKDDGPTTLHGGNFGRNA